VKTKQKIKKFIGLHTLFTFHQLIIIIIALLISLLMKYLS